MEVDKIKEYCIGKWSKGSKLDKRLASFLISFDKWIAQIPDSDKDIILTLIKNLEYYSRVDVNEFLEKLHKDLLNCNNVTDENTIYTFIKSKDGISNSSNDYWTNYKMLNEVNPNLCYEDINAIYDEQWKYISNIVFIDDFSGSGRSFIKELEKYGERFRGKNVYFIVVNIMSQAKQEIEDYAKAKDINIVIIKKFDQNKAFDRDIFNDNDLAKEQFRCLSKQIKIPNNYIMGFEDSEALIAYYNNTPNNTLGLIHYDTENYSSIFPRNKPPRPSWQNLKKRKDSRITANYNNKKR